MWVNVFPFFLVSYEFVQEQESINLDDDRMLLAVANRFACMLERGISEVKWRKSGESSQEVATTETEAEIFWGSTL